MARKLNMLFLVILLLTMVTNVTKGLPHKWYSDVENPSTNVSYYDSSYGTKLSPDDGYTLRKMSKGNYAINGDDLPSRSDGKIIFPSDDIDPLPSRSRFESSLGRTCENLTFCEHPVNYPSDLVEAVLREKENKEILKIYSGADFVPDVVHRVSILEEYMSFCDSEEMVVYPRFAQGKDNEWFLIPNWGEYRLGVRVEICKNENHACNLIDDFTEGYQVMCKQQYIYRQVLTVTPNAGLKLEQIRLPSSCSCVVKFTGNPLQRIGPARKKMA